MVRRLLQLLKLLKELCPALFALAGFTCLALYLTDPLRAEMSRAWAGGGELEEWIWNYWFFKKLIAEHFVQEPHPWLAAGKLLMRLTDSFTDIGNYLDLLALSIPLEARYGAPLYYNIKVIAILVLNGLGGFLLFRRLGGDSWVAFLGGMVFTFNSFVVEMINEARVREALVAPLPLFALFLLKSFDEQKPWNPVLAGLFLGLSAAVYWFYGIFLFYFLMVFLLVRLITRAPMGAAFPKLAVMALMALVVVLPFGAHYFKPYVTKTFQPHQKLFMPPNFLPSCKEIVTEVPGRIDYNINNFRVMLKDSRAADYPFNGRSRHRIFPALCVLALALAWRRQAWFWLACAGGFYLLSLGPYLKMGCPEVFVPGPSGEPVVMPYAFAYTWTPALPRLFHPNRAMALLFMSLGALICVNWSFIRERLRLPVIVNVVILALLASGLVLHERQSGQFPPVISHLVVPGFYGGNGAPPPAGHIVEAPWQPSKDNDWMLYQTVHGRRILWGSAYCGDFDQNASGFVRYMRALGDFKVGTLEKKDIETIREKGFTMLLLHEIACYRVAGPRGGELFAFMEKQLRRRFGQPKEEFSERPRLLPHDFENRAEWGRVLRFGI